LGTGRRGLLPGRRYGVVLLRNSGAVAHTGRRRIRGGSPSTMFKLLRYYAIASLVCVLVAAVLLTTLYRTVSRDTVVRMAERGNLALGQAVSNSVGGRLVDYIAGVAHLSAPDLRTHALPEELAQAVHDPMRDTSVIKVKVFNLRGRVVFSTDPREIGLDQADNPGFIRAMDGRHVSEIVYRDAFNRFDRTTEEDNVLQTYIPMRVGAADSIHGVFEICTDVNPLVARSEQLLFIILGGAALVLTMLYGALLLVVRRANGVIEAQQSTIRERTERLEALTAQLLANDESQRKSLAMVLHEGIAQTLSTIKLKVEMAARTRGAAAAAQPDSIVPLLAAAIEDTRTLASALRPSSLDDFGLLATIAWFCREFLAAHPELRLAKHIAIDENKVAAPLKIVIFRILESAMKTLGDDATTERIELTLGADAGAIALKIAAVPRAALLDAGDAPLADPGSGFVDLHERAIQSGGRFSVLRKTSGGIVLSASWAV
jgi:Histidine kinase